MANLSIEIINQRIKQDIDLVIIDKLSDVNMMSEYSKYNSVKQKVNKLQCILEKYAVNSTQCSSIISDYMPDLIPVGTKSCVKGLMFNKMVKTKILTFDITRDDRFIIKFESKCPDVCTDEIPDWYIVNTTNKKTLIGMNSLDLWSGGQQINRGYKYVCNINSIYNGNVKMVSVICNQVQVKSTKSKVYHIFNTGFKNSTLCYLGGLQQIICDFFK